MRLWIKDECDFINGGSWSADEYSDTDEGIPVLKVSNFQREGISFSDISLLKESSYEKYKRHKLKKNDLVVATVGSHPSLINSAAGRSIGIPERAAGHLLNQNALCIRAKEKSKIDQQFLIYLAKTTAFEHFIQQRGKGAANQMRIPIGGIKEFVFNFPPLPSQQKIARLLSRYDDLIENNLRRIGLLEELARVTYEEWFVRGRFPGWEGERTLTPKIFSDVVQVKPRTSIKAGSIAPYVPMGSLSTNGMIIDPIEERAVKGGTKFKNGDTLFARITPCLENGKTGFVQFMDDNDHIATGSTEFIVFRETEFCGRYFIYCLSRSEKFRELAIKSMVGSDGRQRVNTECFDDMEILVPERKLMDRFEKTVKPMFQLVRTLVIENKSLREARDLLLPRLMAGVVDLDRIGEV